MILLRSSAVPVLSVNIRVCPHSYPVLHRSLGCKSPESHKTAITLSAPHGAEGVSLFTFPNCLQKSKWLG